MPILQFVFEAMAYFIVEVIFKFIVVGIYDFVRFIFNFIRNRFIKLYKWIFGNKNIDSK